MEASPPTDPRRRSLLGRGVVTADGTILPMNSEFHSGYPEPSVAITAIEIHEDRITLRPDWSNIERVVWMDGRSHPSGGERTPLGHSIGHWEGETLVVDTTHFSAHPASSLRRLPVPSSDEKHLVERFTLAEDGTRLIYEILVEDPVYLAEPVTQIHEWDYRPDIVPGEMDCDLDSARRHLTEF